MSTFTTPADLRMLDDYKWELLSPFSYHRTNNKDSIINVPKGFKTDLATIPRILWIFFPPHGKYAKAAIIHDYLYAYGIGTKKEADTIFLEAMEVLNVPFLQRYLVYLGARLIGKGNFDKVNKPK